MGDNIDDLMNKRNEMERWQHTNNEAAAKELFLSSFGIGPKTKKHSTYSAG